MLFQFCYLNFVFKSNTFVFQICLVSFDPLSPRTSLPTSESKLSRVAVGESRARKFIQMRFELDLNSKTFIQTISDTTQFFVRCQNALPNIRQAQHVHFFQQVPRQFSSQYTVIHNILSNPNITIPRETCYYVQHTGKRTNHCGEYFPFKTYSYQTQLTQF
jgi:hypothetical protein